MSADSETDFPILIIEGYHFELLKLANDKQNYLLFRQFVKNDFKGRVKSTNYNFIIADQVLEVICEHN